MMLAFFLLAIALVLAGHAFRLLRWEQFVRIYERPQRGTMLRGMAGGYVINTLLPLHLGDIFRAVFVGRRMKSGVGFALATVIMDRFLDVWFVALGFAAFALAGQGGASALLAARVYLAFAVVLAVALVVVVVLRDAIKRGCLAVCGIFNDTLKLDGMVFCWSLINTFKDLRRVNLLRLAVNTVIMWAAYLGSYAALAAALTAAGQPMALVDVFDLLFGRSAGDLRAVLPGGTLAGAPGMVQGLLLAWFLLPLAVMWLATLLPEGVRFLRRSEELDRDTTLGREIYDRFTAEVEADLYVLAHATSPFIRSETLAEALGTEPLVFPGDHGGFAVGDPSHPGDPAAFATRLREVLAARG